MNEEWKDTGIASYQISTLGRIRNLGTHYAVKKEVKQRLQGRGYMECSLSDSGKKRYCLVHRLVAKAFLPRQPHHTEVNHKDGDKTNNQASNLEWSTRSLNELHRARVLMRGIGTQNGNSRLGPEDVIEIRILSMGGLSLNKISSAKRTSKSQVSRILSGRHWAHL
jgi:hypothetical protein